MDDAGRCITLRVLFVNGEEHEYPVHSGGDWEYTQQPGWPDRLIVRPYGAQGNARHEVPLGNVLSVMVVGIRSGPEVAS